MKLFFNTKKKTMPQQVKRNEEDIETLKNKGFIVKPRGAYDATKTYHKFDLVSYDGDSYIFVSETDAVGIPVTNETYWQLYTSGGLNIEIGTTETLPAGSNAVVTNSGTSTDAVLNFGIPKGEKGEQGPAGQDGQDGTDGVGVPSGGTTGQVLKKKSNTDYDTEWASDTSGMENPMTSEGDLIYGGPTGTPTALAKGTAGQVLKMKQNGTGPEWANASGGDKLYEHNIKFTNLNFFVRIINSVNTAFTTSSLTEYLYNNNIAEMPVCYTIYKVANQTNQLRYTKSIFGASATALWQNTETIALTNGEFSISSGGGSIATQTMSDTVTEL